MAVRILLVDDHAIVLEGIRNLVNGAKRDWEISGEAQNGRDAVEMVRSLHPDLVVLDITMPIMSGLEAAQEIARFNPRCRILIFTMHDSQRLGIEAKQAGAHGYVVKTQATRDLIRAIDELLDGRTFFGSPEGSRPEPRREKDKPGPGMAFSRVLVFAPA